MDNYTEFCVKYTSNTGILKFDCRDLNKNVVNLILRDSMWVRPGGNFIFSKGSGIVVLI